MSELFPAFKGQHLIVSMDRHVRLASTFPWVASFEQYRIIDTWLAANPRRRPRNQYRFLVNWFQKQPKPLREARIGQGPSDMGLEIRLKRKESSPAK